MFLCIQNLLINAYSVVQIGLKMLTKTQIMIQEDHGKARIWLDWRLKTLALIFIMI